ncbi:hypothetical protein MUK42_35768 [Musa troglodytarum]|uniref:Uncharacterized protein n=1 Tax=Musa troglodytarum TaxID=320322 RepID=A0A9E7FFM7_9LILI|nr:hypothetical protein MUK42_35768 [Musa troglodytarum]
MGFSPVMRRVNLIGKAWKRRGIPESTVLLWIGSLPRKTVFLFGASQRDRGDPNQALSSSLRGT